MTLDSLLLPSVNHLSKRIRQSVDKTANKIRWASYRVTISTYFCWLRFQISWLLGLRSAGWKYIHSWNVPFWFFLWFSFYLLKLGQLDQYEWHITKARTTSQLQILSVITLGMTTHKLFLHCYHIAHHVKEIMVFKIPVGRAVLTIISCILLVPIFTSFPTQGSFSRIKTGNGKRLRAHFRQSTTPCCWRAPTRWKSLSWNPTYLHWVQIRLFVAWRKK